MSTDFRLRRLERSFIVLVALLQGLLLWVVDTGQDHGWWPFSELGGRICWYTLVLGVPTAMTLSVLRLDDRSFWQHAALLTGALVPLSAWAVWNATGAPGLSSSAVLAPYGVTISLAIFVALPWLQCRLQHQRWTAPYPDLFEHAWQSGLTLLLMLVFVGIGWGMLKLWAELFALIHVFFFRDLFEERAFAYLATGTMCGLGILIGRTQQHAIRTARRIVLAVFAGLLPLLAVVALLFIASLPFTGLEPLWKTRSAAFTLNALVGLIVLFTNAVRQDGLETVPYPPWLRRLVGAGLLVTPIYAAIAIYALAIRVGQYGWTVDRYWLAVASLILTAHVTGYAIAVLRRSAVWLGTLPQVNKAISLLFIVVILASNSFVLDPYRLAVNSQIERWVDGRTDPAHLDLEHLRFDMGRRGYMAAQSLRTNPRMQADRALSDALASVLERPYRYSWKSPEELASHATRTAAEQAEVIKPATGSPPPDSALLTQLLASSATNTRCRQRDEDCVYIERDFDGDGSADALLCEVGSTFQVPCQLWDRSSGSWQIAKTFTFHDENSDPLKYALRAGQITIERRRWPDLRVGDHLATPADTGIDD